MSNVVVIGGGLAGLASAALLGHMGHTVTLLEKNKDVGGRARVWKSKGFTFDLGPSWYTMPEIWERYLGLMDKRVEDYLKLRRLEPVFKVYFESHTPQVTSLKSFVIKNDKNAQGTVFDQFEMNGSLKLQKHLQTAAQRYRLAGEILYKHYERLGVGDVPLAWRMRNAGILQSLGQELRKEFTSDEARKLLGFGSVFLGGSPENLAGLFSLLNHAIFTGGVYYPMGGMGRLVDALVAICRETGVVIKKGESVTKLQETSSKKQASSKSQISKVITNKAEYECDAVVSAADYWWTETKLLPPSLQTYPEGYWRKKTLSPSAYCLYLGVKGKLPQLEHHTMYFSADWQGHFESVFKTKRWPEAPSIYISTPSKTDRSVAPLGHENVFVLVPIAAGLTDNSETRSKMKDYAYSVLQQITGVRVRDKVVVEREFSVQDFAADYNTYQGSAFGLANTLFQTAWFRPQLQSKKVSNLYYAGQNTQPGIGMPMCAISAELVAQLIDHEH